MSSLKVIKRYANRKLYDTERSSYVTLEDLSLMIKAGDEIQVIDNKSGEDLTAVTLAQIIFESEKKRSVMPLGLLRSLVRDGGGALSEFYRDQVDKVQAKAHDIRERAEKIKTELEVRVDRASRVIARKGDNEEHAEPTAEQQAQSKKLLSDLVVSSQKAFDELQKGVEDRFKGGVGTMSRYANLGREMDEIRKRLAELEERLEKFPQ